MIAFYFNPRRRRIRENVKLFHAYAGEFDAWIGKAGFGDPFGESFNQQYMPAGDNAANGVGNSFVVNHPRQAVPAHGRARQQAGAKILDPQIDIYPHPLRGAVFVRMHADVGG